ncbi:KpsF/GutQ family sugar-phosphate isomerase [Jiella sp. MQZ9-1]|uniref:KpsF/GutQ family sugar-phosphate isomerase n=1 Tax=Jiella flava TaxID=2816857 RepID=A0A939FT30_9HYPH|nr:KpsF/GutQ family sugar-phosphate isomerase [Jiella flava]MBO0661047.1 KpsF/GutQ family sugar-phosphate isomerase [Jiella flava]MCD2469694.1 KpsF/GutQ family sugar-phosphate isomerase [Jiella flava]
MSTTIANRFAADLSASSSAARTIETEIDALKALAALLKTDMAASFERALDLISAVSGRLIVTGVGKSGHIGSKIAATFASTGTPSFFVHPSEANHGDLGMIGKDDAILAMSWSGETAELQGIVAYSRRFRIPLIAVTSRPESTLGREADETLLLPRATEACPLGLAPTSSSTMQLVMGDALAVALLERRGFTPDDFHVFHPGGQLGASLKHVADIMHTGEAMPLVASGTLMAEAIITISRKGFGCVGVVGEDGRLKGMITDGDLRRHLDAGLLARTVDQVMTPAPKTIKPDMLAAAALEMINAGNITAMMVVREGRPVGIVHLHDLLRLGVA